MTTAPRAPATKEDDQQKSHTPDKLRNDEARWKDKDMPEAEHGATPEDYERPGKNQDSERPGGDAFRSWRASS